MIEALVATSLVIVGILGIMSLLIRSAHVSAVNSNKLVASYLAAEGIEYAKNAIDAAYVTYHETGGTQGQFGAGFGCSYYTVSDGTPSLICSGSPAIYELSSGAYTQDPNTIASSPGAVKTVFARTVAITPNGANIAVNSMVTWTESGVAASTTASDIFTNWRY